MSVTPIANANLSVTTTASTARQTPRTDFGAKLGHVLDKAADVAVMSGALVAPLVPPAGLVSAAVSATKQTMLTAQDLGQTAGQAPPTAPGQSPLDGLDTGTQDLLDATRQLQAMNHSMNLEFLRLQENAQQENRTFSTLSQLLASRHQSARTAIQNIGR